MKNFKKNIALLAALACAGTMLAGCNTGDGEETTAAPADGGETTAAPADNGGDDAAATDAPADGGADAASAELSDDGDKLTILCWTGADLNNMIPLFCQEKGYTEDQITWVQVGENGEGARDQYEQYLKGDEDADILILEADWILKYLNDQYTAPLSALGIDAGAYKGAYPYTVAIGTDENGVLRGASWQAAAGGYVYRTDLAEQYLGVTTPDDMQAKIGDWTKFEEAAKTVLDASGGKTSMAATLGDIAKNFRDNNYVTNVTQWSDAWFALGQDDSTMGYFFSTWCLTSGAQLEQASGGTSGATYGKYNICVGPSNYAWGGSWLAPSVK